MDFSSIQIVNHIRLSNVPFFIPPFEWRTSIQMVWSVIQMSDTQMPTVFGSWTSARYSDVFKGDFGLEQL